MDREYILTLSCPDKPGIVASVSAWLAGNSCNIQSSAQYGDPESNLFFMRVSFLTLDKAPQELPMARSFQSLADGYGMLWELHRANQPMRVLLMVSKQGHCLSDLLYRAGTGALPINIAGIVSNHENLRALADRHFIPYHHLPVTQENKAGQEQELREIIRREGVNLVVLARYMQVLSPELSTELYGRCINIHHSFLPGFRGARPYHQAHARGVKLIGATAHYVTAGLDEGPIIDQGVERVDHAHTPEDLAAIGRDVECLVLARAVKNHAEHRILLNGGKTVILR